MTKYVVMTSTYTKGLRHVYRGKYGRIAVAEIDPTKLPPGRVYPARIDPRSRGMVRIVRTWDALYVGKTDEAAFNRTLIQAEAMVAEMNRLADLERIRENKEEKSSGVEKSSREV